MTNLHEALELGVLLQLILHALLGYRQVTNVDRVRQSELRSRVQEDIANALNYRRLLPLPYIDGLEQLTVAFTEVQHVAEDLVDKLVNLAWSDHWRVRGTQWPDVELCTRISVEARALCNCMYVQSRWYPSLEGIASLYG